MTQKIEIYCRLLSQLAPTIDQAIQTRGELKARQRQAIELYRAQLFADQLQVNIDHLQFDKMEYGKPFLANYPDFAFNHSHGREHYALAFSHNVANIGIDVESLARKVRFDAFAQHAFHPQEYQAWKATGENPFFWFQVWTTKEAILKACGLGIRMDLNQLNTQAMFGLMQGRCQHPDLGNFCYRHVEYAGAIVTMAWRHMLQENPEIILHAVD
ncbi:4'-phosphopantetheinyl transferase family protein [Acinetobacter sp. MD2]|uniref:4'-phosphopantetheinyl transferase family protein n=1 Tax=Acinetobacter sp. MD2 TaxID=2600066 RepID=UPI002D1F5698|nr:4'-phosphopantetheinyl transferase superfamily protein [Acinetobacter sp. MD2]MEB3767091.1 4'-phosphopantetheinyl transferase superfamily protein [Acinetobacter sp. MD2]